MIIITSSLKSRVALIVKSLFIGGCVELFAGSALAAQPNYTLVDLTAMQSYGDANAASGGAAAGTTSSSANFLDSTRAALWTASGLIDLHPALLLGGRSRIKSA